MSFIIFRKKYIILFSLIGLNFHIFNNKNQNFINNNAYNNLSFSNYFNLSKYFVYSIKKGIYFNFNNLNVFYSLKFNLVKIIYNIRFFDNNKNTIIPSDLALYYNFNFICHIKVLNKNIEINSLANIYKNSYFICIEYFAINEKVKIGIKIIESEKNHRIQEYIFILYSKLFFNYEKGKYINEKIFDFLFLNKEYMNLYKKIYDNKLNEKFKLKLLYLQFPLCSLKRVIGIYENKWFFRKIFNNYFCFCKGFDCYSDDNTLNRCKYFFYLSIIDNNRNLYKKESYFFLDFVLNKYSSDDVFPIFTKMVERKFQVHYMTENLDIYNKYCFMKSKCLTIIYVNEGNYTINGFFLEKYLSLILKIKSVITGGGININYINNIFYNIEYITYICVGHGISFLKYFLYSAYNWYGHKVFDKILIPPSKKLISVAQNYGWDNKNIIKINLPRWDKYDHQISCVLENKAEIYNNSIFIMFTWRKLKKDKYLSKDYLKNILNLINNQLLNSALKNRNIILYFTLHHKLACYKNKFITNEYIRFLETANISEVLSKTNLVVSDFSSIIFDIIYRKKPFVLYVPDANDPEIENIYIRNYYELILSLKNGTISFENKFFNLNEAINKIIYYIKYDYTLEPNLQKFYESFGFKKGNNTNTFINYITSFI